MRSAPAKEERNATRRWTVIYNRYIPGANGSYQRQTVEEQRRHTPSELPEQAACERKEIACESEDRQQRNAFGPQRQPARLDLGDLLLLCIVLLLLIDSEEDDMLSVLITAAAFLLL